MCVCVCGGGAGGGTSTYESVQSLVHHNIAYSSLIYT